MSLPTTPAAYNDCYEIWDAATRLPGGCRTLCGADYSKANYLRMRMHQARQILREQAKRAYPREHPAWGLSEYDAYKITLKEDDDGDHWLYVEYWGNWAAVSTIEPIPEDERGPLPSEARLSLPAPEPIPNAQAIPPQTLPILPHPSQDDLD